MVFIGLGSVGAPVALALVQAGVGRVTLIDPDRFSIQNVSRHPGDLRDLGREKTVLMAERIQARNPGVRVDRPTLDVCDPAAAPALQEAIGEADLWLVSTDDPAANLAANRLAVSWGRPALFVGVFEGGTGGEIFLRSPDRPGCYGCLAAFRARLPRLPRADRAHD